MPKETMTTERTIRVFSGKYVDPLDFKPEDADIESIAHALAHQVRFSGHMKRPYSVAQHSYTCSYMVPPEKALEALLHDGSEGYLVDIPRPLKPHLTEYRPAEDKIMHVIAGKFGFNWPMSPEVHQADYDILVEEWENLVVEDTGVIQVWSPQFAKYKFLQRFYELTGQEFPEPKDGLRHFMIQIEEFEYDSWTALYVIIGQLYRFTLTTGTSPEVDAQITNFIEVLEANFNLYALNKGFNTSQDCIQVIDVLNETIKQTINPYFSLTYTVV